MAKTDNLTDFLTNTADAIRVAEGGTSGTIEAQQFEERIKAIPTTATSDADAIASQILQGASAYVKGVRVEGNIPTKTAVSKSINPGSSYTLPAGYYDSDSKITANNTPLWNGVVQQVSRDSNGLKGTWDFDDDPYIDDYSNTFFSVNFTTVGGSEYVGLSYGYQPDYENYGLCYHDSDGDATEVYNNASKYWISSSFQTITIKSTIDEVSNGSELLGWLQANATKAGTTDSEGVYYGNTFKASLTADTIITLPVKGLKMDSDIRIVIE